MPERRDPYKVLQVDAEADPDVIQAAYRRLAQKYHPDLATDTESTARMAAINDAWQILRDPVRRAEHDRERAAGQTHVSSATSASTAASYPPAAHNTTSGATPQSTAGATRAPETTSGDWTTGRSSVGGGYDRSTMHKAEGLGAAGPPPGNPSGSVLNFGRYVAWSLGEIARQDLDYIEWLDRMPIGRPYRDEIDAILRRSGRRRSAAPDSGERRGLFRRR